MQIILYIFNQNQTPRSDSANLEPSEPIFYPQILEPRISGNDAPFVDWSNDSLTSGVEGGFFSRCWGPELESALGGAEGGQEVLAAVSNFYWRLLKHTLSELCRPRRGFDPLEYREVAEDCWVSKNASALSNVDIRILFATQDLDDRREGVDLVDRSFRELPHVISAHCFGRLELEMQGSGCTTGVAMHVGHSISVTAFYEGQLMPQTSRRRVRGGRDPGLQNLGGRKWVLRVRDWPSQNGVFGFD